MVATDTALNLDAKKVSANLLEEAKGKERANANLLEKVGKSVALRRKWNDLEKRIVKKSVQQELVN